MLSVRLPILISTLIPIVLACAADSTAGEKFRFTLQTSGDHTRMPQPGASFVVQAMGDDASGPHREARYLRVGLSRQGYHETKDISKADLVVNFAVVRGEVRRDSTTVILPPPRNGFRPGTDEPEEKTRYKNLLPLMFELQVADARTGETLWRARVTHEHNTRNVGELGAKQRLMVALALSSRPTKTETKTVRLELDDRMLETIAVPEPPKETPPKPPQQSKPRATKAPAPSQ